MSARQSSAEHEAGPFAGLLRAWRALFPMPAEYRTVIAQRQFEAQIEHAPTVLLVMMGIAPLTALVLWGAVPTLWLLLWIGSIGAFSCYRLYRWFRSRRRERRTRTPERVLRRVTIHTAIAGLIWGVPAALLMPAEFHLQMFLVAVLAAMCAGMVATSPALPAMALCYVVPVLVSILIPFAFGSDRADPVLAAMLAIYIVALVVILRSAFAGFCDGVVAAERARRAEQVLADSIEALGDAFILTGPDGRVRMHNRQFLELFSYLKDWPTIIGVAMKEMMREGVARRFFVADPAIAADPQAWIERRTAAQQPAAPLPESRYLPDGRVLLVKRCTLADGSVLDLFTDVTAVKRAEARLRDAVDSFDDGFVIYDAAERIVLHNRRQLEIYPYLKQFPTLIGRTREETIRTALASGAATVPPGYRGVDDFVVDELAKARRGGRWVVERALPDGRVLLVRMKRTADGALLAVSTDISAIKRAERRLMAAIEAMEDGFVLFDRDERLILHNRRYVEQYSYLKAVPDLVGLTRGDLLRLGLEADALHRSGTPSPAAADPDAWIAAELGRLRTGDVERHMADGHIYLVRTQPTDEGGSVVVITDVTAVKRAERRLIDAVESMSDAFALWDADDRLVLHNSAYAKLFAGVPESAAVGKAFPDILRAALDAGAFPAAIGKEDEYFSERVVRHRNPEAPLVHPFHDGRWLRLAERRTTDGGIVAVRTDVTEEVHREQALRESQRELAERVLELEEAEEQLRRQRDEMSALYQQVVHARDEAAAANSAKSAFLANMSHELRTPLNAIIGFSEIMQGRLFGDLGHPRYDGYIGDMLGAARHLLKLINDILDLSKVEAGKWDLREEPVDIARLLDSVLRMFRSRQEAARLSIRVETRPGLPLLRADEKALTQIVSNAVSNAIKFTPAGGQVRVRARRDAAGRLRLVIADSGIGIKPADMEKAMTPFGQVDNYLTRRHQGTGLGLPIAKALAERHGGSLRLRSQPERGTSVMVTLPAERFMTAMPAPPLLTMAPHLAAE